MSFPSVLQELAEAFTVLSDAEQRKSYDQDTALRNRTCEVMGLQTERARSATMAGKSPARIAREITDGKMDALKYPMVEGLPTNPIVFNHATAEKLKPNNT